MSITQILRTVINREHLVHRIYGQACHATTVHQQDSRVRSLPSRLKLNDSVLVEDSECATVTQARRSSVDLVNDRLDGYRLGTEGRLIVAVHDARP